MNVHKIVGQGTPYPLGTNMTSNGYNFALYSSTATKVELCFFDYNHNQIQCFNLPANTGHIWHGLISGVKPGDLYGYRVHGPWDPINGNWFNPAKLTLDPYTKKISHTPQLSDDFFAYERNNSNKFTINNNDNGKVAIKGVIFSQNQQLNFNQKKNIPWSQTVIYEAHTKAMTRLHPAIPLSSRGKLSGLKHPSIIDHLKKLGVTTIELMPIQAFISEESLTKRGLTNFWGYNPISFMAIHPDYCESDPHLELSSLVNHFHQHDLEIILDVVFNHTAESDNFGPQLSFKGIDNKSYYLLDKDNLVEYHDYSGCGNVINSTNKTVWNLIIDALEFWASFGVDGFRIDLTPLLMLDDKHNFSSKHPLFAMIQQSKKLQSLKMIAEPWSFRSYELGNFPENWLEYNDQFRNNIKQTAIDEYTSKHKVAHILAGTDSLFSISRKKNHQPINYITNHDGFSLFDLVAYKQKHNHANNEDNKDGSHAVFNTNYGTEGVTTDDNINSNRLRHIKNLLCMIFFSQGIPMIRGGDEFGQTFHGNNNTYCHDNELTWLDWRENIYNKQILSTISKLIQWRKKSFKIFTLKNLSDPFREIIWLDSQANILDEESWNAKTPLLLGMLQSLPDIACYLFINLSNQPINITLPKDESRKYNWQLIFSSADNKIVNNNIPAKTVIIWQGI